MNKSELKQLIREQLQKINESNMPNDLFTEVYASGPMRRIIEDAFPNVVEGEYREIWDNFVNALTNTSKTPRQLEEFLLDYTSYPEGYHLNEEEGGGNYTDKEMLQRTTISQLPSNWTLLDVVSQYEDYILGYLNN